MDRLIGPLGFLKKDLGFHFGLLIVDLVLNIPVRLMHIDAHFVIEVKLTYSSQLINHFRVMDHSLS
jgi:hypothetical protein